MTFFLVGATQGRYSATSEQRALGRTATHGRSSATSIQSTSLATLRLDRDGPKVRPSWIRRVRKRISGRARG